MNRVREWIIANLLIIVAVLAAVMTVATIAQTIRINGLRVDLPLVPAFGPKGLIAERDEARQQLADFKRARDLANQRAQAARAADEADIAQRSRNTDHAISQSAALAAGATERFIAAGGLPDPVCCPRRPAAADPIHSAGSGAPVHPAPQLDGASPLPPVPETGPAFETGIVRVTAEDVRICTGNTIIAEETRDLLLGLEARSP